MFCREQRARHQDDKGNQWRDGLAHGRQERDVLMGFSIGWKEASIALDGI